MTFNEPVFHKAGRNARRRRRFWITGVAAALCLPIVMLASCGNDEKASPEQIYCDAAKTLRTDVQSLVDLDVIAEGTNAMKDRVSTIRTDLDKLIAAGSDLAKDDVAALQTSVDQLQTSIDALGTQGITVANASNVLSSVQALGPRISALWNTISDTCA